MFLIFFLLKRPGKGDRRAYEVRLKKKKGGEVLRLIFLGSVSRVTRTATSWGGREEISEVFRLCLSFSKLFVEENLNFS